MKNPIGKGIGKQPADNLTDIIRFGISVGNRLTDNENWLMAIERDIGDIEKRHDYNLETTELLINVIAKLGDRQIAMESKLTEMEKSAYDYDTDKERIIADLDTQIKALTKPRK